MSVVSSRSKFHCLLFSQPFRRNEGCLVTKRTIREKKRKKEQLQRSSLEFRNASSFGGVIKS